MALLTFPRRLPGEKFYKPLLETGLRLTKFSPPAAAGNALMPAFYKIDQERRIVMTTGSGVFTLADALAHQQKLANDPEFDPSFSQLIDLTHLSSIELSVADVHKLAEANIFSPQSRRAILVQTDLGFGLARMFEALRESAGEDGIHVFRELNEALDWILAKDTKG